MFGGKPWDRSLDKNAPTKNTKRTANDEKDDEKTKTYKKPKRIKKEDPFVEKESVNDDDEMNENDTEESEEDEEQEDEATDEEDEDNIHLVHQLDNQRQIKQEEQQMKVENVTSISSSLNYTANSSIITDLDKNNDTDDELDEDEDGFLKLDLGTEVDKFATLFARIDQAFSYQQEQAGKFYRPDKVLELFQQVLAYWKIGTGDIDLNFDHYLLGAKESRQNRSIVDNLLILEQIYSDWKLTIRQMTSLLESHLKLDDNNQECIPHIKDLKLLNSILALAHKNVKSGLEAKALIQDGTGRFNIQKDLPDLYEDIAIHSEIDFNEHQKLMQYVSKTAKERNYFKKGDKIYEEIQIPECIMNEGQENEYTIPSVKAHAVKQVCSVEEFVHEITASHVNITQWYNRTKSAGNCGFVINDFIHNQEKTCLRLDRDRRVWTYRNGVWDGNRDLWIPHYPERSHKHLINPKKRINPKYIGDHSVVDHLHIGDASDLPPKFAIKFIDTDLKDIEEVGPDYYVTGAKGKRIYLDESLKEIWNEAEPHKGQKPKRSWFSIDTPCMSKIMKNQGWSRAVQKMMYVFLGRLAFEIGIENGGDNWAACPLMYGRAGAGKTTLATHICGMYDITDVFDMESKGEETFLLQNSIGKLIWRIMELKGDLRLAAARYQCMVEGGRMPIPIKNVGAEEIYWTAPGLMIGNDRLPFNDAQGSISRRTIIWEYIKKVMNVDTFLHHKLREELPNSIRKCVLGYKHFRNWVGSRGIWQQGVLPEYFVMTNKKLQKNVNPVSKFLMEFCSPLDLTDTKLILPLSELIHAMPILNADIKPADWENEDGVRAAIENYGIPMFEINKDKIEIANENDEDENDEENDEEYNNQDDDDLEMEPIEEKIEDQQTFYLSLKQDKIKEIIYQGKTFHTGWFLQGVHLMNLSLNDVKTEIIYKETTEENTILQEKMYNANKRSQVFQIMVENLEQK